jgi:tripartite-type tricarboxylate transporter receptor subunit TctC
MNIFRKVLGSTLVALSAMAVQAQQPSQITLIVPYPPGGLTDSLARLTGKVLGENMKVTVVVENKPGANGLIGLQAINQGKPDGSVIGIVPASVMTVNPSIYKNMKIDTVKDLTPLTLAVTVPNVLVVNTGVPANNVKELVDWLKKSPGTATYATPGSGSSPHLNSELFAKMADVQINHVPYKGAGPAMNDLLAGNIQMAFANMPTVAPLIQAGKLKAIGVTSPTASSHAPNIPPIGATLRGYEDNIWFGFIGPKDMPSAVTNRLNAELGKALRSAEVTKAMNESGATITTSTPQEMGQMIATDLTKWAALIKERNLKAD